MLNDVIIGENLGRGLKAYEEKNFSEAYEYLHPLASNGDSVPQYYIGRMFYYGEGVDVDYDKAYSWLKLSAEHGLSWSQYQLAILLAQKNNNYTNLNKSFELLLKSANQNYIQAQVKIGEKYFLGIGTEPNEQEAIYWYTKAAEQGSVHAQFNLSGILMKNEATKSEAFYWCNKAAENGFPDAMWNLCLAYEHGLGVNKDIKMARHWLQEAAKSRVQKAIDVVKKLKNRQST